MIRVVLQRLQENGLVKIVPYKVTTVTRLNREIVDELIYERIAVEARVLRDLRPSTPEQRALIRRRADAYDALARAERSTSTSSMRQTACSTRHGLPPWEKCICGVRCRTPTPITAASGCWTPPDQRRAGRGDRRPSQHHCRH